jgi:fluoride ion exporter CrcB/FEX
MVIQHKVIPTISAASSSQQYDERGTAPADELQQRPSTVEQISASMEKHAKWLVAIMWNEFGLIGIGSYLGTTCRFLISGQMHRLRENELQNTASSTFDHSLSRVLFLHQAYLSANIVGSFVMSLILTLGVYHRHVRKLAPESSVAKTGPSNIDLLQQAATTGFCGCLTSFSTWFVTYNDGRFGDHWFDQHLLVLGVDIALTWAAFQFGIHIGDILINLWEYGSERWQCKQNQGNIGNIQIHEIATNPESKNDQNSGSSGNNAGPTKDNAPVEEFVSPRSELNTDSDQSRMYVTNDTNRESRRDMITSKDSGEMEIFDPDDADVELASTVKQELKVKGGGKFEINDTVTDTTLNASGFDTFKLVVNLFFYGSFLTLVIVVIIFSNLADIEGETTLKNYDPLESITLWQALCALLLTPIGCWIRFMLRRCGLFKRWFHVLPVCTLIANVFGVLIAALMIFYAESNFWTVPMTIGFTGSLSTVSTLFADLYNLHRENGKWGSFTAIR